MISMLIGTVAGQERDDRIVVNCGGVGYSVAIGKRSREHIEVHGKAVTVYCRQTWHETTGPTLWGWLNEADRALFDRLLRLDGFGPSRAAKVVDAVDSYGLALLCAGDAKAMTKRLDGIGPTLVARIRTEWGKL